MRDRNTGEGGEGAQLFLLQVFVYSSCLFWAPGYSVRGHMVCFVLVQVYVCLSIPSILTERETPALNSPGTRNRYPTIFTFYVGRLVDEPPRGRPVRVEPGLRGEQTAFKAASHGSAAASLPSASFLVYMCPMAWVGGPFRAQGAPPWWVKRLISFHSSSKNEHRFGVQFLFCLPSLLFGGVC